MKENTKVTFDEKIVQKNIEKFKEEALLVLYSYLDNSLKDEILQDENSIRTLLQDNLKNYPQQTKFVLYSLLVKNEERMSLLKNEKILGKIFDVRNINPDPQQLNERLSQYIAERQQKETKTIQQIKKHLSCSDPEQLIDQIIENFPSSVSINKISRSSVVQALTKIDNKTSRRSLLPKLSVFCSTKPALPDSDSKKERLLPSL